MSFLRRRLVRNGSSDDAWVTTPEWAAPLAPRDFEHLARMVQREVGPDRIPDPAALREFATGAELGLPNLIPLLLGMSTEAWPPAVHIFYASTRAFREAGDALEARSQTFEAASEALRIHWMPRAMAPAGDVAIDGPIPDTVEVLALDTGASLRHVSNRLFERWAVSIDEAVRVARDRVLALPLTRLDWSDRGHPAVRIASLEGEGPYAGALLAALERVDPTAIGPFGTLVGVPVRNALVYRALDASPGIRADLGELAVFAYAFADQSQADGFLTLPIWRRPDGRCRIVRFRFAEDRSVEDSHDPGFAGVLCALDPRDTLTVPGWAERILDAVAYTRFAGCVAAVRDIAPIDVARLGSAWSLPALADRCRGVEWEVWPPLVEAYLRTIAADVAAAEGVLATAAERPDEVKRHLVAWLDRPQEPEETRATRPLGTTGLVEVLAVHEAGETIPVLATTAAALGAPDELFTLGRDAVRRSLQVAADPHTYLSGDGWTITGAPSVSAAIPHLPEWLPDRVGPFGALAAIGSADLAVLLPIHDAGVVLDLPALAGLAVGMALRASWPLPPTVFWVTADRVEALRIEATEGVITGLTSTVDLVEHVARLPTGPRRLPPGLEPLLGAEGARRLYGLLHAAVVERLSIDPAGLTELTAPGIRDVAAACRARAADEWSNLVEQWLDDMGGPRQALDMLTLATDYATVAPSLGLRVARRDDAGSELDRDVGGGLAAYPTLDVGPRHRRVTRRMLNRWGVDEARCWADAVANTALDPALVDEPMFADNASARALYAPGGEREAAALGLHLRRPGSRRGFVISITHGSRAHYLPLDDPEAITMVPAFARVIAGIHEAAARAADAHSPWLLWLTPDGRTIELFDVRQTPPPIERLPAEFVATMSGAVRPRAN